ncbi:MAG TPA: heterodisulfide reductase-related iron-sulfur binding cluster, partial [Terriglobales bacterium]|nr:heterodisulfide reductase-related iron-sulfur binding cluster [Terriglobales bacterium]
MSELVQLGAAATAECPASNFSAKDKPTWELYSTCIHCGLCLNHCPTYRVLGTEMDSPRGRIYQVLQVDEGKLPIGESFVKHIDRCLGCLACETACPSGVQYGHIVERARAQIETHYFRPWLERKIRSFFFTRMLRDFQLLSNSGKVLRFYQQSGLQKVVRASGILHLLGLAKLEKLTPKMEDVFFFTNIGMLIPAEGQLRARVGFHAGCISNMAFVQLNHATVRLLARNGVEVHIVGRQRCCGALQAHAGFREDARLMARRNIDAFGVKLDTLDAIVTNAAGCGSTLRDYPDLLKDDPNYAAKAKEFSAKVKDVTEYLAQIGMREPLSRIKGKVAFQDPCHLNHAQKIRNAPRELLKFVGATLVELPHPEQC